VFILEGGQSIFDGGWLSCREARVGDEFVEMDGGRSVIVDTRYQRHLEGIEVYNFRVCQSHTYFVREEGSTAEPIWVHNAYRALRQEDLEAFQSGERIMPKGTGGSILEHIQGRTDTKYISVSQTLEGTATYEGPWGIAEIGQEKGSGVVIPSAFSAFLSAARYVANPAV